MGDQRSCRNCTEIETLFGANYFIGIVKEAGAKLEGTEVAGGLCADNTRTTGIAADIVMSSLSAILLTWGSGLFELLFGWEPIFVETTGVFDVK